MLGSLKSHEQRLEWHSKKSIESAFQYKLTINFKNFKKRTLSHEQGEMTQLGEVEVLEQREEQEVQREEVETAVKEN